MIPEGQTLAVSELVGTANYFEDFPPGRRIRHQRGATVGEVENNLITKQVMNTSQHHWNDHAHVVSGTGSVRVTFGLVTASLIFGLASEDTCENAIRELGCTGLRFNALVMLGDHLYAYTEVLAAEPAPDHDDAGIVRFKHWGVRHDGTVVFEGERTALIKRRSHWLNQITTEEGAQ
jgi:itaconyl-CoA hydratase